MSEDSFNRDLHDALAPAMEKLHSVGEWLATKWDKNNLTHRFTCTSASIMDEIGFDHFTDWTNRSAVSTLSGTYGEYFTKFEQSNSKIEIVQATGDPEHPFKNARDFPIHPYEMTLQKGMCRDDGETAITHATIGIYKDTVRVEFHGPDGSLTNWDENYDSAKGYEGPRTSELGNVIVSESYAFKPWETDEYLDAYVEKAYNTVMDKESAPNTENSLEHTPTTPNI